MPISSTLVFNNTKQLNIVFVKHAAGYSTQQQLTSIRRTMNVTFHSTTALIKLFKVLASLVVLIKEKQYA